MMLQTENCMISYLLKAYLIKLIQTDPLGKEYITFFHPFYKGKDFSKWVFTLIVWPEDTSTHVNTEYHVQSHKQTKAWLTC